MLRTNESRLGLNRTRGTLRWATLPVLGALALLAAGLRPAAQAAEPKESVSETKPDAAVSPYNFAYLPKEFLFFVAVRPSEIAASPRLGPLAELFTDAVRPGIPANLMEQATFALGVGQKLGPGDKMLPSTAEYIVIRTNKPVDFKDRVAAGYSGIDVESVNGRPLMSQQIPKTSPAINRSGLFAYYSPNDSTLVGAIRWMLQEVIDHPNDAKPPADAAAWIGKAKGPLFVNVNLPVVKATSSELMGGAPLQLFQPILDLAEDIYLTIEDQDPLILRIHVACKSPEDAVAVEKTMNAALVLIKNLVDAQLTLLEQQLPGVERQLSGQDLLGLFRLGRKILHTAKVNVDGAAVTAVASVDDPKRAISESLVPQLRRARQAAQRAQAQNNLKNLGLAALNFESNAKTFPPAVVYGRSAFPNLNASGDKSAHVPRSWRVELLPLLGQEELYKQYRLDQPWDSEANLKVLRQMPAVYRSPFDQPTSTNTSYFAVAGPGTVFDGEEGTPLAEIRDGTSNTLLWVEAKRDIPWTKPEDIAYAPGESVPTFGGWMKDGEFAAAYCDGSVRIIADVTEPALRQLIERTDGAAGLPPGSSGDGITTPAAPLDK